MMRYGLGWRAPLAAQIYANLDCIDVVEVMAEDFFDATKEQKRALRFLREHVTIVLHATSLGLASTERVDRAKLDSVARVAHWLEPEFWSEHLAFVRGGGFEVGHLAAPPRNDATLAGLVRNADEAQRVVGSLPLLENVASLIEPPLCAYDERAWLHAVLDATPCDLLLDLHNVHANAVNFGFDARDVVASLPRVRAIHLAGGKRIERGRVLDDHRHACPDEVFELLSLVQSDDAAVILERDGEYPVFDELLDELDRARGVRRAESPPLHGSREMWSGGLLAHRDLIPELARMYATGDATTDLDLDRDDLALALRSFERKRATKLACPR